MKKFLNFVANIKIALGLGLMLLPVAYIIAINTPEVWYRLNPDAVQAEVRSLTREPFRDTAITTLANALLIPEPAKNASLPTTGTLIIPKIGVNTPLLEGHNEEELLSKGVWKMPGYGSPSRNNQPIVLAAHRWGPITTPAEYRSQHMFINLPNLVEGDKLTIVWEQREYIYQVRKTEVNQYVSELADLILITCQYYDSPERILVYAERIA